MAARKIIRSIRNVLIGGIMLWLVFNGHSSASNTGISSLDDFSSIPAESETGSVTILPDSAYMEISMDTIEGFEYEMEYSLDTAYYYEEGYFSADTTDAYEMGDDNDTAAFNPADYDINGMTISAFLIYDDDTESEVDLIATPGLTLWNTVIGEGDSGGSSSRIRIELRSNWKDVRVDIRNGKTIAVQESHVNIEGLTTYIINDTGCQPVNIMVFGPNGDVVTEKIDFMCGE